MQPIPVPTRQLDLPPVNTAIAENSGKFNHAWIKWLNNLWAAVVGAAQRVSPSVVDNFVSFSDTVGNHKDSGLNSGSFAPAAKGVTNGDSHDHAGGDGAQINHTGLSNIGTNTHAQIDSHIASVANPHQVTYSQTGAEPANANIQTHIASTSNPHNVTKSQVGLSNVPNTDCTNATNISSGTLDDARLSSNVALKNINNNFAASQNVTGDAVATGKVQGGTAQFGGVTNYSNFEADGTLVFNGDATVWEDLNFDPTKSGGPAAQRPDDVTINNVFYKEFTSANNQSCGDSEECPHKMKLNETIFPHFHCFLKSGESAGTTGVTFTIYWELRGATTTSGSVPLAVTSAQLTAGTTKVDVYDLTGFSGPTALGAQLALAIYRTGGDAGDVIVTTYGVHYKIDTAGSREITSK